MRHTLLLSVLTALTFTSLSQAQQPLCSAVQMDPVGYSLSNNELKLLQTNLWFPSTKRESNAQIIKKITDYMNNINPKADPHIPGLILLTAGMTQVDPYLLTALIKKESTFDPKRISSGSAYGLTQLTGDGLSEVRNQLGVHNPKGRHKTFKPRQTEFFHAEVLKFFTAMHQWRVSQAKKGGGQIASAKIQKERYIQWLQSTEGTLANRKTLHSRNDYALITGALLFKIKLAKTNNDYRAALIRYNGDKNHRIEYSQIVMSDQQIIRNQPVSCEFDDPATQDVLRETCEITQDKDFCEQFVGWQST